MTKRWSPEKKVLMILSFWAQTSFSKPNSLWVLCLPPKSKIMFDYIFFKFLLSSFSLHFASWSSRDVPPRPLVFLELALWILTFWNFLELSNGSFFHTFKSFQNYFLIEAFDTFGMDSRVRHKQGTGWYDTEAAGSQSQYAHPSWMKVIRRGDLTPKLGESCFFSFKSTFKKQLFGTGRDSQGSSLV